MTPGSIPSSAQPQHPSAFLPEGIAEQLRRTAAAAEEDRDLHPDQLRLIYEKQWFRMLMPDGPPLSVPEVVRLEEGVSWADGSVGWTVTLCSGAGWFAGFFPPDAFPELFLNRQLCLAGSGAPSGEAHITPGGYRVNGRWDYASGALHATAFTANCYLLDNGRNVLAEDGTLLIRPFLFKKEEVTVDRNWNTIGLIATGSHAFNVQNVEVPADRCFIIDASQARSSHPVYRYPFLQLAEVTLAANLSGLAMHFLDCSAAVFPQRIKARNFAAAAAAEMTRALEDAQQTFQTKRTSFYAALDSSWQDVVAGERHNARLRLVSQTSRELAAIAKQVVDKCYPYGGLGAARPDTEINRVWRDLHTASQHNLLAFR